MEHGRRFLKVAASCLVVCLKQVPALGGTVDMQQEAARAVEELRAEQQRLELDERIRQLEEAAATTPEVAFEIGLEAADELSAERPLSAEGKTAYAELMSAMPARIAEQTRATIALARRRGTQLATALPVDPRHASPAEQSRFYAGLLPNRRPRFRQGDPVPNGPPSWRLQGLLGSGGFGEVWRARHRHLGEEYAIKFCLDASDSRVLQREAETLLGLRERLPGHPNIVRLTDLHLETEPCWLAFEYIRGGTLEAWIQSGGGPQAWETVAPLARGILEGMAAAHDQDIVHRDLKPANILLTRDGTPKIADFGLGKLFADDEARVGASRSFTMRGAGTVGYMSPEQQDGAPADATDDVYSLGVVLLQMLAGSLRQRPRYVCSTLQGLPAPVPEPVQDVIRDCIEEPRHRRPANAAALLRRLESWLPVVASRGFSSSRRASSSRQRAPVDGAEGALRRRLGEVVAERGGRPEGAEWFQLYAELVEEELAPGYKASVIEAWLVEEDAAWREEKANRAAEAAERALWEPQAVSLAPLKQREVWNELDTAAQDAIARRIEAQLAKRGEEGWVFLPDESRTWSCGGERHRICAFKQEKTKAIFHLLPGGAFLMGSPDNEWGRYFLEGPQHEVAVPPLLLARTPVTRAQWLEVDKNNPSDASGKLDHPVENMSHRAAEAWCKAAGLRLPSEAEWEYACRAGTTTRYSFGDDEGVLGDYAWYDDGSKNDNKTHPVGTKKPNAFGLFDFHGNVWEWCADPWHDTYAGAPEDGSVWTVDGHAFFQVYRGGSAWDVPWYLRSTFRFRDVVGCRGRGFRPAGPRL